MTRTLPDLLRENETLWIPVAYDHGEEIDGIWQSGTHFGAPTIDRNKAWAAARELCDAMDGIGFCVRRADPAKETTR